MWDVTRSAVSWRTFEPWRTDRANGTARRSAAFDRLDAVQATRRVKPNTLDTLRNVESQQIEPHVPLKRLGVIEPALSSRQRENKNRRSCK